MAPVAGVRSGHGQLGNKGEVPHSDPYYGRRPFSNPSFDRSDHSGGRYRRDARMGVSHSEEEGVEVVLGSHGDKVVDGAPQMRRGGDQNVFRAPHAARHRVPRPGGPPPPVGHSPSMGPPPHVQGSASFSYGHAPPGDYPPPRPYPVTPYNPSGSFEDGSYQRQSHYSPHVQYPPPGGRYPSDDVNVISPTHKGDPKYRPGSNHRGRPPPSQYYQYPPTSPVSRPGGGAAATSPPRLRNFAVRRPGDGPYSKAQRGENHNPEASWSPYPGPSRTGSGEQRPQPPLVTESSFDSDHYSGSHYSSHPSHPPTPGSGLPPHHERHHHHHPHHQQQLYGSGGSFGSFDSAAPPPPHFDNRQYPPHPESPFSPYSHHGSYPHYSPGYYPPHEQYSPYSGYGPPSRSYEDDERGMLIDYHPDKDGEEGNLVSLEDGKKRSSQNSQSKSSSGIVLPKAASEVDFEVTDPPTEPITEPSEEPLVQSLSEVNGFDVLCGRGGGTNSQIGNKRFRKLVQEFQPTYLLARRKEKPLLARTIVLIIRKRGGRFLRKDDDTGQLFEVGDVKAEAKTSQALREGLDVRATKSAANSLMEKKKKKKKGSKAKEEESPQVEKKTEQTPDRPKKESSSSSVLNSPESPPTLPRLQDEEIKAGMVHPHSPENLQFRKRRRMRSAGPMSDKLFPDFCPPRAQLHRSASPLVDPGCTDLCTPQRRNTGEEDLDDDADDPRVKAESSAPGCSDIAFEIMTGTAGSFCLGPSKWRAG